MTEVTKTATAAETKPTMVSQKYVVKLNAKKATSYRIPKDILKKEGKISSEFKTFNGVVTQAIIRGLTPDQERYFAAELINKTPKDQGFEQDMLYFWANFSFDIPEKLNLDASYYEKLVKIDGIETTIEVPVNLYEYMKANMAKQSSRVAFTNEEKQNSDLYDFIMEDLSVEERNKVSAFKTKQLADKARVELLNSVSEKDHTKLDWLLDVLKEPNEFFYKAKFEDKAIRFDELATQKPDAFLKAYESKSLETDSLFYRLLQLGILTREGEAIFFGDTALGSTEKEAKLFLSDATKSAFVAKMKAQLTEVLKR